MPYVKVGTVSNVAAKQGSGTQGFGGDWEATQGGASSHQLLRPPPSAVLFLVCFGCYAGGGSRSVGVFVCFLSVAAVGYFVP